MPNKIMTEALLWEKQGSLPSFVPMPISYEQGDVIIQVRSAMFGKALHRAITIGHPKIHPPRVLGTLLSGDVVSETPYFPAGTRVVVNPHTVSDTGETISIYPGAMSRFVRIQGPVEQALYSIPCNVEYDSAVYCELVACALESIAKIQGSSDLVIIGCGLMALIQIQIAKYMGIENVICIYNHSDRIELIKKYGGIPIEYNADESVMREHVISLLSGHHSYAVIDSAGTQSSLKLIFQLSGPNSKLVLFAGYPIGTHIDMDANDVHYQNCQILGSYHFGQIRFAEALDLLESGAVDIASLITGKVKWDSFDDIFDNFQRSDNISNVVVFD